MGFCLSLLTIPIYARFYAVVTDELREIVVLMTTVGAEKNKGDLWGGQISVEDIVCHSQIPTAG